MSRSVLHNHSEFTACRTLTTTALCWASTSCCSTSTTGRRRSWAARASSRASSSAKSSWPRARWTAAMRASSTSSRPPSERWRASIKSSRRSAHNSRVWRRRTPRFDSYSYFSNITFQNLCPLRKHNCFVLKLADHQGSGVQQLRVSHQVTHRSVKRAAGHPHRSRGNHLEAPLGTGYCQHVHCGKFANCSQRELCLQ